MNSAHLLDRLCFSGAIFCAGAVVMIVEIVGARILSPFFGVGLFAWSALIAVTLTSLAIGYAGGGRLSSHPDPRKNFSSVVVVAGVLLAVIPLETRWVLEHLGMLDVRLGALLVGAVLFSPVLLALGTLSPLAVASIVAERGSSSGNAAGRVFAISTAGSLVGTLLAGFVLIPNLALTSILVWSSALLLAVGLREKMRSSRTRPWVLTCLFIPWLVSRLAPTPNQEPIPGVRVLESATSIYGHLEVIEDSRRREDVLRLLRADQSFLGGIWLPQREPAFGFIHLLEAIRLARPAGNRMLLVGLGTGSLVASLKHSKIETDVVEIDPHVVRLATRYFDFEPTGTVYTEDARTFLKDISSRHNQGHVYDYDYDYIVHDTFTGGSMPAHMLTRELFDTIRARLRPHGLFALNVVGAETGPFSAHVKAIAATLRSVFEEVRVFRDGSSAEDTPLTNLVFFAASEPIVFEPAKPPFESPECARILRAFAAWEVSIDSSGFAPVTDAENPLEWLGMPMNERFRRTMLALYPAAFWLN
ncbi:MAG: fused MFS/spermidine synthase [Deltaproteobacteria bacterium]|nr:fused MFS/spermidine synthase [Deltaproteobacteria bacterium]